MDRLSQTELGDALHRASAQAPPTGINVDALVVEHRRWVGRRRWLSGGAAVAVVAVGVLTATYISGYGNRAGPVALGDPQPQKTSDGHLGPFQMPDEPASLALPRLDRAVRQAFQLALADRDHLATDPDLGAVSGAAILSGQPESGYKGLITLTDALGVTTLQVIIQPSPMPAGTRCGEQSDSTCTEQTGPDGTRTYRQVDQVGASITYAVEVFRPDGTHLLLIENNVAPQSQEPMSKLPPPMVATRSEPVLDLGTLARIAQFPALTLFP